MKLSEDQILQLTRYAYSICFQKFRGNYAEDSEDIAGSGMTKFLNRYKGENEYDFKVNDFNHAIRLMGKIIQNTYIDFMRKKMKNKTFSMEQLITGGNDNHHTRVADVMQSPEEQQPETIVVNKIEKAEIREMIIKSLFLVNSNHREILVMRFYFNFSIEEISAILMISRNAADARLHNAKRNLAKVILENERMKLYIFEKYHPGRIAREIIGKYIHRLDTTARTILTRYYINKEKKAELCTIPGIKMDTLDIAIDLAEKKILAAVNNQFHKTFLTGWFTKDNHQKRTNRNSTRVKTGGIDHGT
ncbi:MAG: sigma-70 family RNA polymerase sigma factor [Spirochaetales bacterium]|nr:sigma-70 family RNA polymerase sigma factor [Spirochaetales bacterium]